MTGVRVIEVDGGVESVRMLSRALAAALDGGEPVLPLAPGASALRAAMRPQDSVDPRTAVVIATSGSTGTPKGVLLSAPALIASARATHDRLGGPGHWLLATPAQYVGGLQVLVRSLLAGTEPAILDLSNGFRPAAFAEAAAPVLAADGPHYTALVPTQLARILDAGSGPLAAARGFDAILLGGASTPVDLRERAAAGGLRVVRAYGMSETAGGCVYDGRPLDGVRVRVDSEGRVLIAGDVLAIGYRDGDLPLVDGWLRTEDLGELGPDGALRVTGRADDVVNTGGVKVPAGAVARALAAHPGVAEAAVVGLDDPEWGEIVAAAVVPASPTAPDVAALAEVVREQLGAPAVPKRLRFVTALPLRGPGKVDREAVRRLLREGSVSGVASSDPLQPAAGRGRDGGIRDARP